MQALSLRNIRIWLALAVLGGGVTFAIVRLLPHSRPSTASLEPEIQAQVDDVRSRLDRESESLRSLVSEADRAGLDRPPDRGALQDLLVKRLRTPLTEGGLGNQPTSLVSAAADRLSLFAFPDFDAYAAHVRELTGRDILSSEGSREVFLTTSRAYANARFVWDQAEIREHIADPLEAAMSYGMHGTSSSSERLYGKPPSEDELPRCRDVVVPLILDRGEKESVPLRLVLSFRPGGLTGWLPFSAKIYEAGQVLPFLPTPWI